MQRKLVESLGKAAILGGISALARCQESAEPFVGFDTEYTSRGNRFLSYQLAGEKGSGLFTEGITIETLEARCMSVAGDFESCWLITFWSIAELQFLPILTRSKNWRLYGAGSFDCEFETENGRKLKVFDISRFWSSPRQSLRQVAEAFGLKKLEYDTTKVTKKSLRDPAFIKYAVNDAILCYQLMQMLRAEFLPLGADPLISKTAAGTAATVFRRRIEKDTRFNCQIPRARLAGLYSCWGGRAEVFERGDFEELHEYDIESAYPNAAVAIGEFPTGESLKEATTIRQVVDNKGFAQCIFRFPDSIEYPCLPIILDYGQFYPSSGIAWATSFELQEALERNCKLEMLEGWYYTSGDKSLAETMQWALDLRARSTGAQRVATKLIANSLIGKLAQRRRGIDIEKMRKVCEELGLPIQDVILLSEKELEALGLMREAKVGTCFMPEWNGLITGHVRAQLSRIIDMSEPVYCATDSVWSKKPIKTLPPKLGLKRSGPGTVIRTRFAAIYGEKDHIAHHSIWSREAALQLLTGTDDLIEYKILRPIKLKESIRKRIRLATFVEESRRGSKAWDGKRELLSSGKTRPWKTLDHYYKWRVDQSPRK